MCTEMPCTQDNQQVTNYIEGKRGPSTYEESRAGFKILVGRTYRSIRLTILVVSGKSLHVARRTWSFHQHFLSERFAMMNVKVAYGGID